MKIRQDKTYTFERLRTLDAYRASNRTRVEMYEVDIELATGIAYLVANDDQTFGVSIPVSDAWFQEFDGQTARTELKIVSLSIFRQQNCNYLQITLTDDKLLRTFGDFVDNLIEALSADMKSDPGTICLRLLAESQRLFRAAGTSVPSDEAQVGLLLELEALKALSSAKGTAALQGWTGPENDRHDFELESFSVECKATLSRENFIIAIHGARQLLPSGKKPLILVARRYEKSVESAVSVPQIIRELSAMRCIDIDQLARKLAEVGISPEVLEKETEFTSFRPLESVEFEVDERFPQISLSAIPNRLSHVSYSIDLRDPESIPGFHHSPMILKDE